MLSEALRLLRVFHDYSQTEIADELGVTKSWISEIESGNKIPTMPLLEKYSEVLGMPLSSILFFSEQLETKPGKRDKLSENVRASLSKKVLSLMDFIAESGTAKK